jgi:type II secretory pathway pseudopilin PulG
MLRRRPAESAPDRDDVGFSLAEIMVTMGIMSILMVIVTTAILQVYRTSAATESLSSAQAQLQVAFQRADKELRYASWIDVPAKVGTTWYVEYAGADVTTCGQLRLLTPAVSTGSTDAGGVLQLVRWTAGTPLAAGVQGQTLASTLVTDGADPPFALQTGGDQPYAGGVGGSFATDFQRLRMRLTTRVGDRTTQVDTTFTALNSSRDNTATSRCSEGRPTV